MKMMMGSTSTFLVGTLSKVTLYITLLGTHKWRRIEVTGYQPPGRRSLQGTAYGEKSIIYFGGFSTRKKIFYSDLFILDTGRPRLPHALAIFSFL